MKTIKQILTIVVLLLLPAIFIFMVSSEVRQFLGFEDSSALYGGELEKGYPSAGYFIGYKRGGGVKTCGFSVLNNRVGITASHCVDDTAQIFIGKGDFNLDNRQNLQVVKAIQKEGWIRNKERANDFAIINFNDNKNYFNSFAEIASPVEGCNFRVVAYGRTEDPAETSTKPRKSATVCASQIEESIFYIQGDNSGICFGDSGSPVYYKDTEIVVGVVASIVLQDPNDPEPCQIGNRAIVVRADKNRDIINENIQSLGSISLSDVQVTDGVTIEVAEETLWDKLGLSQFNGKTGTIGIFLASSSLLVVMIIAIIVVLSSGNKKKGAKYYS